MTKNRDIQLLLKNYGFYTGNIDGIIGTKSINGTHLAYKYFNLEVQDYVNEKLFSILCTGIKFNNTLKLKDNEYVKEDSDKKSITLHHTAGWSVTNDGKDNMNFVSGWNSDNSRIATAYSIGYSGTIYNHFNDKYWAYHLGLKTNNNVFKNKSSIGIELVNEGELQKNSDNSFSFWAGRYNRNDKPIEQLWREFNYWSPYSKNQFDSSVLLVVYLSLKYEIPLNFTPTNLDFNMESLKDEFTGIYSHSNVRLDKRDVSPAFDWKLLNTSCHTLKNIIVNYTKKIYT